MDLALFDFDGTITTHGTYPEFVRVAARPARTIVGGPILAPLILGYRAGVVSDRAIRAAISRVAFWRDDPQRLRELGERFATEVLPAALRPGRSIGLRGTRLEAIASSWSRRRSTPTSSHGAGLTV